MLYKRYQPIRKILRLNTVIFGKKLSYLITGIHYKDIRSPAIKLQMQSMPPTRYGKIVAKVSLQFFYLKNEKSVFPLRVIPKRNHHYEKLQIERVSQYIKNNLLEGDAIIVIAGSAFRKPIALELDVLGLDVQAFKEKGQLRLLSSELFLAGIRTGKDLDPKLFHKNAEGLISALKLNYGKVHAIDEMVSMLWKQEQYTSSLQLRNMWSGLNRLNDFRYYALSFLINSIPLAVTNFKNALMHIITA